MNFADTNWLSAMFFEARDPARTETVERFLRKQSGLLGLSQIVLLEAENVFRRNSGLESPPELEHLKQGFNGRFYLDPMNWDLVRREAVALLRKYAHKTALGTFDVALFASARQAGATRLLSFDGKLKALAVAEGMEVFPELDKEGRAFLAELRR